MKRNISVKAALLSALFVVCGMSASAEHRSNLIYNLEEANGLKVAETIYKSEGSTLAKYMKYNYTYDAQRRMTQSEGLKWNDRKGEWEKDICLRYAYNGKSVTTTYYKWNQKKGAYELLPDMTVTMDATNL